MGTNEIFNFIMECLLSQRREVEDLGYNYELISSKPLEYGNETATILC